jgi:long-chain fatty acid transport protein
MIRVPALLAVVHWLAFAALLSGTGYADAAGYAIAERDAAGLGRAFAGQAALIEGASVSINPAAIPQAATFSASLSYIANDLQPADAGENALVPAAFATFRGFGLAIDAPFGLSTDYPRDWPGRYSALHSEINTWRVTAAGGFRPTPKLRLGAGFFAQRMDATLIHAYRQGPQGDTEIRVDGADLSPGFLLGLHWQPRDDLALGIGYTSPVWFELDGDARLPFSEVSSSVKVVTPESITAGLAWTVNPHWQALAGLSRTRWSRLETLDIRLADGASMSEVHDWRDTWRISLGGEYERGPWTLRLGSAWDQSPVPDADRRYPRLPDSDRTWGALGIGYRAGEWVVDLGYAHLWFDARDGAHPPVAYRSSTDILALGITRSW